MNTRHTPGPWVPNPLMLDQICTYGGEPTVVAYAYRDMPADIVIANANLIAAAPDLLNALRDARQFIALDRLSLADSSVRPDGTFAADDAAALADYDSMLEEISTAITKASGEEA